MEGFKVFIPLTQGHVAIKVFTGTQKEINGKLKLHLMGKLDH